MGGHALGQKCDRLDRDKHDILADEILTILRRDFSRVEIIPFYKTKTLFGDIDLIVEKNEIDLLKYIYSHLSPKAAVRNGQCYSFTVNQGSQTYQVDLIYTPAKEYETTKAFLSWNVLGMLMGRTARLLECRYGGEGLKKMIEYEKKSELVLVSTDVSKIITFLGYDYEKFVGGFDTMEEIYEYAISSPFFIPPKARGNNHFKTRLHPFLEWLSSRGKLFERRSIDYNERLFQHFPEFTDVYASILNKLKTRVERPFNGHLVMNLTGLKGKELGDFMKRVGGILTGKETIQELEEIILNQIT